MLVLVTLPQANFRLWMKQGHAIYADQKPCVAIFVSGTMEGVCDCLALHVGAYVHKCRNIIVSFLQNYLAVLQ